MARVETIIVGGGINANTPFTVNRIPYILQTDPPFLDPSPVMSQVTGVNPAIVISPTAADPQASTTTILRVAGGIASFSANTANGRTNTVLGQNQTVNVNTVNAVLIGNDLVSGDLSGTKSTVIGQGNTVSSSNATVVGGGNSIGTGWGTGSVIIVGSSCSIGNANGGSSGTCVFIGDSITLATGGASTPSNTTVVGSGNVIGISTFSFHTIVGYGNQLNTSTKTYILGRGNTIAAAKTRPIVLGSSNTINHDDCIVMGEGITTTAANQCLIGGLASGLSTGIKTVIIGTGDTSGAPQSVTLRLTDGAGANIQAGDLTIRPGAGTGNATPGSIIFQTSTAGASGAALQAISTRWTIGPHFVPGADNSYDIGTSAVRIRNLYGAGTVFGRLVGARVRNSATQSITSAVNTALTFDTEDIDTDAFHDNVTNPSRLTVPAGLAGTYHISAGWLSAPNATGTRDIMIRVNGVTVIRTGRSTVNNAANGSFVNCETMYTLAVGDYVEAVVAQDSGGALNSVNFAAYVPILEMYRISN